MVTHTLCDMIRSSLTHGNDLQALFALGWIYLVLLTFSKLSVLAMFWRIFPRGFVVIRRGCILLSALSLLCFIAGSVVACVQCQPLRKAWAADVNGHCFNPGALALGNAIPSITIEFAILLLPVYEISQLPMALSQKIAIAGIFLLGFL